MNEIYITFPYNPEFVGLLINDDMLIETLLKKCNFHFM